MAPRGFTNPAPKTESAKEARKAFFCELCQKGYSRMNEYEAHEASYDHQHTRRLRDLKQMQRDPKGARRAERKADEMSGLITIKPLKLESEKTGPKAGFKKAGFKSAFAPVNPPAAVAAAAAAEEKRLPDKPGKPAPQSVVDEESDTEDEDYEHYDPRIHTGCEESNAERLGRV
ncbi:hypothetical protein EJ06DRAFT_558110 [Trichodelitschia bisporula]|uniref:C2H2-type domain-containing protein n=1 Tax=Trichodelitschia bisporula TaxID=703511 RepID=A0A6G1HQV8_9PEZI|nr:hypothetical protein EJ06DRAFT_558110 [Trichodelitschia bisporula]